MPCCSGLWGKLTRKKPLVPQETPHQLARVLDLLDLTFLGVGSTLGAAMYVLVGQVARNIAGPAVVLSFAVAAAAAFMAGICYAEFGARVPNTGSAYVYGYIIVGELAAFIIGWNLLLEYVIGTACAARAWSANFDSLTNDAIERYMASHVPFGVPILAEYPDFFAVVITLVLTGILVIGVKLSTQFNNVFTVINLLVIAYVVICGMFKVDFNNWNVPKSQIHRVGAGVGGFFPFGIDGMLSGAASCFFAFVGFDCIATTGEEAIRPERNIPLGILMALLVVFLSYVGVSSVLTLMVPYYLIDSEAPIPMAFEYVGWGVAKYIISVGAVCGLSTSLLGSMFPMPRVIYAMAGDGVIFRCLAAVSDRFRTPVRATILSGVFSGLMALFFDQQQLVDMLSIGTLLAYTLVAVSVLFVRYRERPVSPTQDPGSPPSEGTDACMVRPAQKAVPIFTKGLGDFGSLDKSLSSTKGDKQHLINTSDFTVKGEKQYLIKTSDRPSRGQSLIGRLFTPLATSPTSGTEEIAVFCIGGACLLIIFFDTALVYFETHIRRGEVWVLVLVCGLAAAIAVLAVIISRQPQDQEDIKFKVPFLPVLPLLSTFANVYLMLKLSTATWIRFGVWMTIGFGVYFFYGIKNSNLSENPDTSTYQNLDLVCLELEEDSPRKEHQNVATPLSKR